MSRVKKNQVNDITMTESKYSPDKLAVRTDEVAWGTNISDVKVPKHLRNRFKCEIPYIDDVIGGRGFTPSTAYLFTGVSGGGKTTMMLQLANAITRQNGIAVFNTAEESLFQTKMTAERLHLRNFIVGGESTTPKLLERCDQLRAANPGKQLFLIVDSLQVMRDGKHKDGGGGRKKDIRNARMLTNYAKTEGPDGTYPVVIVIGQVNKSGKMAGANEIKHIMDGHLHLSVEEKDEDLRGCRVLRAEKNRFGGCGSIMFLSLQDRGFVEMTRISAVTA